MNTTQDPAPGPDACLICDTTISPDGACAEGHRDEDRADFIRAIGADRCGICGGQAADWRRAEETCENPHTPEELAAWQEYISGGEDHLPGCQEFTDYDGSPQCTCGGMMCGSGFTTGPAHDPYGAGCEYIRRDHPKTADGRHLLHRGGAPLGERGDLIEWTGGGTCAGDPLPYTIVRHLTACPLLPEGETVPDEGMHEHMAAAHGWTMGAFERDDYPTLRATHYAALNNMRVDAERRQAEDEAITRLRDDCIGAGNSPLMLLCGEALRGDPAARQRVAGILAAAREAEEEAGRRAASPR